MPRAKAYERRRHRPHRTLRLEQTSPLRGFFTRGLELDPGVGQELLAPFHRDCELLLTLWGVAPEWGDGMELKLRRLGQHRAEGVYYPEPPILVVDPRSTESFAHELGHHIDYTLSRARGGSGVSRGPSSEPGFRPYRDAMIARMMAASHDSRCDPRRRTWWRYYTSPTECFARAFEQCTAELLPQPSAVVREPERYRTNPLFLSPVPAALLDYFRGLLETPAAQPAGAQGCVVAAACAIPASVEAAAEL